MKTALLLPIHLDGLRLDTDRHAITGHADFQALPFVSHEGSGYRDIGADRPFVSNTVLNEVFNDSNGWLQAGLHLHWELPECVRTARHPVDSITGLPDRNRSELPAAPDRWLVCCWMGTLLRTAWIVESDFVWSPKQDPPACGGAPHTVWPWRIVEQAGLPHFQLEAGGKPYRFLGRVRELNTDWPKGCEGDSLARLGERLTASGYGDPGFASFYPNCRSVFGFFDPAPVKGLSLWYEVFGWYSDPALDPLAEWVQALQPGESTVDFVKRWERRLGRRMRLRLDHREVSGLDEFVKLAGHAPAADLEALVRKGLPAVGSVSPGTPELLAREAILAELRLSLPKDTDPLPGNILCYGRLRGTGLTNAEPPALRTAQVVAANTGTEAAAAWAAGALTERIGDRKAGGPVADLMMEKSRVEDLLEAVNLARDTANERLDVGTSVQAGRHERGFRAFPGSPVYQIRPRVKADGGGDPGRNEVPLPAAVAAMLDTLNLARQLYDRGIRRVNALRFQLFADWRRAMDHTYTHSDASNDYLSGRSGFQSDHDLDALTGFLKTRGLTQVNRALERTGELLSGADGGTPDEIRVVSYRAVYAPVATGQKPVATGVNGSERILGDTGWKDAKSGAMVPTPVEPSLADQFAIALNAIRSEMRAHPDWELTSTPGPRYFQPADPTILIISENLPASPRMLTESFHDSKGRVRCEALDVAVIEAAFGSLSKGDTDQDRAALSALSAGALRQSLLTFASDRTLGEDGGARPLYLDWQAEVNLFRRGTSFDVLTGQYAPSFIKSNWVLGETSIEPSGLPNPTRLIAQAAVVRGRSSLSGHARGVLMKRLEHFILRRLSQPVVLAPGTKDSVTLPNYFDCKGVAVDDGATHLRQKSDEVQAWIGDMKRRRDYASTAAAVTFAMQALGKSKPFDLVIGTKLEGAILGALNAIRASTGRPPRQILEEQVGLDGDAIDDILTGNPGLGVETLFRSDGGRNAGRLSLLLRYADATGQVSRGTIAKRVYSHPVCAGLPQGGAIEQGILKFANEAEPAAMAAAKVLSGVIAAVCEHRAMTPIHSLAALLSIRPVTSATLWKMMIAADRQNRFGSPEALTDPETQGEVFWQDERGHDFADPLTAALDAWLFLQSANPPVTATLSGFNDSLLMRRRDWQLPVADPLAFPEYRSFTEGPLREAIGSAARYSPQPVGHLVPIRAGELNFAALRVVDVFGQFYDVPVNRVSACSGLQPSSTAHIELQPRLTQAARLNLRWLAADVEHEEEWNSHPAKTPVCGWLARDMDGSLLFYSSEGEALGAIDLDGRWRPLPGRQAPVRAEDIDNIHLRRVAADLCEEGARPAADGGETWMERFGDLIESAIENIDPHSAEPDSLPALLLSRPLAVVRVTVSIELRDPAAVNQSYQAFAREVAGAARDTAGVESVQMPIRLGEHMRLNDGVVGYWLEGDPTFYAPQSVWRTGKDLRPYREKDHALNHWRSLSDKPLTATVLLDPRGLLHATCGMLPTKAISLPPDLYAGALRKLRMSILCAPVLSPPGHVELPLRPEPPWTWTWTGPMDGRWDELPLRAILAKSDVLKSMRADGPKIWDLLVHHRVLEPMAKQADQAVYRPENLAAAFADPLFAAHKDRESDLRQLLESKGRSIRSLPAGVDLQVRELREGWLRLTPAPAETGEKK